MVEVRSEDLPQPLLFSRAARKVFHLPYQNESELVVHTRRYFFTKITNIMTRRSFKILNPATNSQ